MNVKKILLIVCFTFNQVFSSQGIGIEDYSGVIYSPNYKVFAVAKVLPDNGVITYENSRFFSVFKSESNKLIWTGSNVYGPVRNINISDDGEIVVVFRNFISSNQPVRGVYSDEESKRQVEESVFLKFFKRNELIKTYALKELDLTVNDVLIGSRGVYLTQSGRVKTPFEIILESENIFENPVIIDNYMLIEFSNERCVYFDIRTGKVLDFIPKAFEKLLEKRRSQLNFLRGLDHTENTEKE